MEGGSGVKLSLGSSQCLGRFPAAQVAFKAVMGAGLPEVPHLAMVPELIGNNMF